MTAPHLSASSTDLVSPDEAVLIFDTEPPSDTRWPGPQLSEFAVPTQMLDSDAEAGSIQRLRDGFEQATSRFVLQTGPGHLGGGSIAHMVRFSHTLAASCGLEDFSVPLVVLTAYRDVETVDAYRAWLSERHPDVLEAYRQQLDHYLHLMRFRAVTSGLHGVDVIDDGQAVRFVGRCRRGGTDGPQAPSDHTVHLVATDDSGVEVMRAPLEFFVSDDRVSPSWVGFTCRVALTDLPLGRTHLFTEISTPDGFDPVRTRVQSTVGLLSSSRAYTAQGRRFQVVPVGETMKVDLLAAVVASAGGKVRWAAQMAALDVKAFLKRRPFGAVRVARLLTAPFFAGKPIWLVGERTDTARDNGYHLFAYLRRERPDIRAYYVIDANSDQYQQMAALGKTIKHSSLKHKLIAMHARVLLGAYSIKYLVPRSWDPRSYARNFAWRAGSYRVYLKHGINDKMAVRRRTNGYDLYFTGVEAETRAALQGSGYFEHVVQAGLARYDALVPTPPSKTILFMPTWRSYLVPKLFGEGEGPKFAFDGSTYQRFMLAFLASERLRDMLERYDVRLQFMPHYNLADHLSDAPVASDRIETISAADGNIQAIMRGCDLFLTDYSSVHFDLAYLGTPLVYTHFDREEFQTEHGKYAWFNHQTDGFGPVAHDLDSTLDALENYLRNGCVREDEYERRAAEAFAFRDANNCQRTVEHVEAMLKRLEP